MTAEVYALPTFAEHLLGEVVDDPSSVDPKVPLTEQFVDSLVLIEISVALQELGVDASEIELTTRPSLDDLYNLYLDRVVH